MKIKTLPTHFRRARFDWEIVERKEQTVHHKVRSKRGTTSIFKWGLFRQDKHWVVARIFESDPHPMADNHLEWDKIETIPSDVAWGGKYSSIYMPSEEHLARKEYESK